MVSALDSLSPRALRIGRTIGLLGALLTAPISSATQPLAIYTEINPPLQFQGPDGQLTGLSVEIVKEIQRRLGNREPMQLVPWARAYAELQTRPQIMLFTIARTRERDPLFQWVGPVREGISHLYVRSNALQVPRTIEEAQRLKSIGVYNNDVHDQFLTQAGFTNLDRTVDNITNIKKLMAGRIQAMALDQAGVADAVRLAGYREKDLKPAFVLFRSQGFLAFSKNTSPATIKAWGEALSAMKRDHTFDRIYRKYLPKDPLPGPPVSF